MFTQSRNRSFLSILRAVRPLVVGAAAAALIGCDRDVPEVDRDLAVIQANDTLVVGTRYNSTSYFLYRGAAMGYEYDLLREFAEANDLNLRVTVAPDYDALIEMLRSGEVDVIAARLFHTDEIAERVAMTDPLFQTQRVLVQRSGPPNPHTAAQARVMGDTLWGSDLPSSVTIRAREVTNPSQLAGESVHVAEESGAHHRLIELSDSIDGSIEVVEVDPTVTTETLIRRVAAGQIDFTVSRENIAQLQQQTYTNIEVTPVLGPPLGLVWGVRQGSTELLAALNAWITAERDGEKFNGMYRKYYVDRAGYRERATSEYLTAETGRLSDWDDLIRRNAGVIGWDWRLIASQMYQESLFDPKARSWAGAAGLLQLMPATAKEVGVSDPYDPEQNVAGGIRYLKWLEDQWLPDVPDPEQRLRFILASYNVGRGHVQDAQRLAQKHGLDPKNWEHVSHWLLQKSKRDVYSDPVVKYGYARGLEPVTYVQKILYRFQHYQQFVSATPASDG